MASKRIPLSIQSNEDGSLVQELPKGEQFYLMSSYQRSKKQNIALIVAVLLFFSAIPAFAIYLVKSASTDGLLLVLFTALWLISLLLFLYSFGVFDHAERWLSYVIILDLNNIDNTDNKIYLFQESTECNYKITAVLDDLQISDIKIIEERINSYFIQISGVIFNEFSVSNKNAAEFVNEIIDYLKKRKMGGVGANKTVHMSEKEEYKKISKAKCSSFGCDICSFNLCSNIVLIYFIIVSVIFAFCGTGMYRKLCVAQQYDDIYDTKYDDQHYDNGCVDGVKTLLNVWKVVWVIGVIVSVFGLFGLYYLRKKWLIPVIVYGVIRAFFWQIIWIVIDIYNTQFIIPFVSFAVHAIQIAILYKTYFIMKSSMTVSYLNDRMSEMEEMKEMEKMVDIKKDVEGFE